MANCKKDRGKFVGNYTKKEQKRMLGNRKTGFIDCQSQIILYPAISKKSHRRAGRDFPDLFTSPPDISSEAFS